MAPGLANPDAGAVFEAGAAAVPRPQLLKAGSTWILPGFLLLLDVSLFLV